MSGLLFTFGALVLPALVAKPCCRAIRTMFVVSPAVAFVVTGAAFVAANYWDLPPAQMAVALLAAAVGAAWGWRAIRRQS